MGKLKSKLALAKQKKAMADLEKDRLAALLRKEKKRTLNAYREKLQSRDEFLKKVTALEEEAKLQNAKIKALTSDLKLAAERSKIAASKLRSITDSLENEGVDCIGSGMAHVPEGNRELTEIKTEPEDPLSPGSGAAVTPAPPPVASEPTFVQSEAGAQLPSSSLSGETEDFANEGEGEVLASVPLVTLNSHKAPSPSILNDSYDGDYEAELARLDALFNSDNGGLRDTSDNSDTASGISMNSYFGLVTPAPPVAAPEGCQVGDGLQSLSNVDNVASPVPLTETPEHPRRSTQGSQRAPVSTPAPGPSGRTLLALASNLPDLPQPPREHGIVDGNRGNKCICGRSFKNGRGLTSHISYFGRQTVVLGLRTRPTTGLMTGHVKRKHGYDSDPDQEDPVPVPAKRQTKTLRSGAVRECL